MSGEPWPWIGSGFAELVEFEKSPMSTRRSNFLWCIFLLFFLGRSFFGVLWVETFEQEGYAEVFLKKWPTVKYFLFSDPYASDPIKEPHAYGGRMDAAGNWKIGTAEFTDFSVYCNYRYGIDIQKPDARDRCKALAAQGANQWAWPYLIYLYIFDW